MVDASIVDDIDDPRPRVFRVLLPLRPVTKVVLLSLRLSSTSKYIHCGGIPSLHWRFF